MNYDEISVLRKHSSAWKLLRADNAPLILSFFEKIFVEENFRSISTPDLVSRLDDELFALNEHASSPLFPKSAKSYLDDWSAPDAGWLRKYYPEGSDEPHFDATPAVEKALSWIRTLQDRSFVGTESRLNTIFSLLRQMVLGAETDPDVRVADLRQRRLEIDAEIARIDGGELDVLDAAGQRDRYQQFAATARELLADFREVEANFRSLDRELRERIAAWHGAKGELLDEILSSRESIADSDQGTSFQAFYDFLLTPSRQDELTSLIERVHGLAAIDAPDPRLRHIHYLWLEAGEQTQRTVRQLSEQLRRFLDDQVWFENRRVIDILRGIEERALRLRDEPGTAQIGTMIDGTAPRVVLPLERPLYAPVAKAQIDSASVEAGQDGFDVTVLLDQVYVDPARLALGVRRALQQRSQVGLARLVRDHPIEQGLTELVTYLALTDEAFCVVFDETERDSIGWLDDDGHPRAATLPRVTFVRAAQGASQSGSQR